MTPEKLLELSERVGSHFAADVAPFYTDELLKLIALAIEWEKAEATKKDGGTE